MGEIIISDNRITAEDRDSFTFTKKDVIAKGRIVKIVLAGEVIGLILDTGYQIYFDSEARAELIKQLTVEKLQELGDKNGKSRRKNL